MSPSVPLLRSTVPSMDGRRVRPAPKEADSIYHTPEYRAWREVVISGAGRRCEAITAIGTRCLKAEPHHRMFADHKVEVKDGGALHDPANGECLCGAHHTAKTAQAKAARRRR